MHVQAGKKQNAEQASKAKDVKSPPLNIGHYLHKIGIMEIRYMRMMASLCNLTYYMRKAVSVCSHLCLQDMCIPLCIIYAQCNDSMMHM